MIVVYDIECLINFFSITSLDVKTNLHKSFIIHKNTNQLKEIVEYLAEVTWMIGYNNLSYDYPMIHHLLCHKEEYLSLTGEELATLLYKKSQSIIESQFSSIRPSEVKIKQLDLMALLHYNNKNKRCSLKFIELSLDWHNIEDMPFEHYNYIESQEDIKAILEYNLNDVLATKALADYAKDQVDLRKVLSKEYELDLINAPEPKLAKEIFGKYLSEEMAIDIWDLKKLRTKRDLLALKDIILPIVKFNNSILQGVKQSFEKMIVNPEDLDSIADEEKDLLAIRYNNIDIKFAMGGIHGCAKENIYLSDNQKVIKSVDVKSFYPNLAINFGFYPAQLRKEIFIRLYKFFYDERSKIPKSDFRNGVYKLLLNSTYGLSKDKHAYLYDPLMTFQITINGQLLLTMLAESLVSKLKDSQLLMMNTDGLEIVINKEDEPLFNTLCKEWESLTNLELEFVDYKKMIIADVNNYIAIDTLDKVKCKGRFEFKNLPLHKSKSELIIPIAIYNHFVKGISIEDTIHNDTNIFNFCIGHRSKSDSYFTSRDNNNNTKKLSKTIRYYISNNGLTLHKNYNDGRQSFLNVHPQKGRSWYATMFNVYKELPIKDYNINYNYYIWKARKEIAKIESNNLKLF